MNEYIKKSDASENFISTQRKFAFIGLLFAVLHFLLWFAVDLMVSEIDPYADIPFYVSDSLIIFSLLAAISLGLSGFLLFSRFPKLHFEEQLKKFASYPDNEMIKVRKLFGRTFDFFLLAQAGLQLLSFCYFSWLIRT